MPLSISLAGALRRRARRPRRSPRPSTSCRRASSWPASTTPDDALPVAARPRRSCPRSSDPATARAARTSRSAPATRSGRRRTSPASARRGGATCAPRCRAASRSRATSRWTASRRSELTDDQEYELYDLLRGPARAAQPRRATRPTSRCSTTCSRGCASSRTSGSSPVEVPGLRQASLHRAAAPDPIGRPETPLAELDTGGSPVAGLPGAYVQLPIGDPHLERASTRRRRRQAPAADRRRVARAGRGARRAPRLDALRARPGAKGAPMTITTTRRGSRRRRAGERRRCRRSHRRERRHTRRRSSRPSSVVVRRGRGARGRPPTAAVSWSSRTTARDDRRSSSPARTRAVDVGGCPLEVALSPDGLLAAVTTGFWDAPGARPRRPGRREGRRRVPTSARPRVPSRSRRRTRVVVAGGEQDGTLTVLDAATLNVVATHTIGRVPRGLALTAARVGRAQRRRRGRRASTSHAA